MCFQNQNLNPTFCQSIFHNNVAVTTILAHDNEVHALAFAPDGKILASGSGDRTVKLWEDPVSTVNPLAEIYFLKADGLGYGQLGLVAIAFRLPRD